MCWYLLGLRLSKIQDPEEPAVTSMMEEIICESEDIYGTPIQRELLPLILYRDMIRERWVWRCTF